MGSEMCIRDRDKCINDIGTAESASLEPSLVAEDEWMEHMNEVGKDSLLHLANSWYMGANIPGKPRALLSYLGGLATYRQQCQAGRENNYERFIKSN